MRFPNTFFYKCQFNQLSFRRIIFRLLNFSNFILSSVLTSTLFLDLILEISFTKKQSLGSLHLTSNSQLFFFSLVQDPDFTLDNK